MTIYLRIAYLYFLTGLFSIGGGLATLPFIYHISDVTGWFSHHQVANMLAISQTVPGSIGVSLSAYSGFEAGGIIGGLIAGIFLSIPGIITILIISRFMAKFRDNFIVNNAFYGLRASSLGLIFAVTINVAIPLFFNTSWILGDSIFNLINVKQTILALVLLCISIFKKNTPPIFFLLVGAGAGVIFSLS